MSASLKHKPKLLQDLVSLIGGQFVSMLIGFLSFTYLARVLDAPSYGALEFAIAVTSFYTVVVECGLGPIGVRRLALDRGSASKLAAGIPAARLLLAVLTVPLVGLTAYITHQDPKTITLVWLYAFSLGGVPWRQDWLLQGLEKMNLAAPGPAIRTLVFALGAFLFVRRPDDLVVVGIVQMASEALCSVYYIGVQQLWAIPFRIVFKLNEMRHLVWEGAAVGVSQLVWAFSQYVPLVLVATLIGGAERAWFGAPLRILGALLAFGFLYHFNLYPISARLLAEDRDRWRHLMWTSLRVASWSGIGLALMLTLFSAPFMLTIFGQKFTASVSVFAILIWVVPIRLLSDHARWALVARGLQRYLLISEVLGALTLLVAGLLMVPFWASNGAAAASIAGNLVTWITAHFFVTRHIGRMAPFHVPLLPAVTAVGWGTIMFLTHWNLFLSGSIAVVGFTACAFLIGGIWPDIKKLAYAKNLTQAGS